MSASVHEVPGQYTYMEGLVMCPVTPAYVLDKIKETELDDTDVVIASYPKSGRRSS